jgi:hypothetical protein
VQLLALAALGVCVQSTHACSRAHRQHVRRDGYAEQKCLLLAAVHATLERDQAARWPRGEEKGVHTAWQGYSALGVLGGRARQHTRGCSVARLVVEPLALGIGVAQRPWQQATGTTEQGDIQSSGGEKSVL